MTFEERIDALTARHEALTTRHEALTMNLELISHDLERLRTISEQSSRERDIDAENIRALPRIAEAHERRLFGS